MKRVILFDWGNTLMVGDSLFISATRTKMVTGTLPQLRLRFYSLVLSKVSTSKRTTSENIDSILKRKQTRKYG